MRNTDDRHGHDRDGHGHDRDGHGHYCNHLDRDGDLEGVQGLAHIGTGSGPQGPGQEVDDQFMSVGGGGSSRTEHRITENQRIPAIIP